MSKAETDQLVQKITAGVQTAIKRLIERTKKDDGELVISRNKQIVRMKAQELK